MYRIMTCNQCDGEEILSRDWQKTGIIPTKLGPSVWEAGSGWLANVVGVRQTGFTPLSSKLAVWQVGSASLWQTGCLSVCLYGKLGLSVYLSNWVYLYTCLASWVCLSIHVKLSLSVG